MVCRAPTGHEACRLPVVRTRGRADRSRFRRCTPRECWAIDGGRRTRLTSESFDPLRRGRMDRRQDLDRDRPVQPRIPCAIDLAHAAGGDRSHHFVGAEPCAGLQRKRRTAPRAHGCAPAHLLPVFPTAVSVDAASGEDPDDHGNGADADLIAVCQRHQAFDPSASHERPVLASQIFQRHLVRGDPDSGVDARHGG